MTSWATPIPSATVQAAPRTVNAASRTIELNTRIRIKLAATIGLTEVVTKSLLYYLHERAWLKIPYGRKTAAPLRDAQLSPLKKS